MEKSIIMAATIASLFCGNLSAQTVSYSLPRTSLVLEVEAVREDFFAGPYAKYASKYLGVDAKDKSETVWHISGIRLTPYVEADQVSGRFTVSLPKGGLDYFLKLTSQGLVSVSDGSFGEESVWRFPDEGKADFSLRGVSSNLTSATATLYQNVRQESSYNKVAVQQNMVVEKSLEKKAAEAADVIFRLRKVRVQTVTGDTDASYSGEAMSSVLAELDRLEKEYMSLFVGYTECQTQQKRFDVVPDKENPVSVAFRISDKEGLVSSENVSGKPVILQVVPEAAPAAAAQPKGGLRYRIPCICTVNLTNGVENLLSCRVPVYQFGIDQTIAF